MTAGYLDYNATTPLDPEARAGEARRRAVESRRKSRR